MQKYLVIMIFLNFSNTLSVIPAEDCDFSTVGAVCGNGFDHGRCYYDGESDTVSCDLGNGVHSCGDFCSSEFGQHLYIPGCGNLGNHECDEKGFTCGDRYLDEENQTYYRNCYLNK